jgi:hypothetical protein
MQILNIKRKHPTKNEYFPKYILFTIIYSLSEQELNNRNYYKQKLNMYNFVQAKDHCVHMYENFGDFTFYVIL